MPDARGSLGTVQDLLRAILRRELHGSRVRALYAWVARLKEEDQQDLLMDMEVGTMRAAWAPMLTSSSSYRHTLLACSSRETRVCQ